MVYTLYRVPLDALDVFKYLGVFVSEIFKWNMHIDGITSWAYQRSGITKRVFNKVTNVAYLTLCRPIMEFACEVWNPYFVRHETQLEKIQRQAVKFLANCKGVKVLQWLERNWDLRYLVIDKNRLRQFYN